MGNARFFYPKRTNPDFTLRELPCPPHTLIAKSRIKRNKAFAPTYRILAPNAKHFAGNSMQPLECSHTVIVTMILTVYNLIYNGPQ
jgi:hypothetical protein